MPFWNRAKRKQENLAKPTGGGLIEDLSELGLSLDMTVSDPSTAMLGGMSKANLRFAYSNLRKGNIDQAISGASSLIASLEKDPKYENLLKSNPAYKRVHGAAYYVRGLAQEAKGMKEESASDYKAAISLHPGFSPAEEGFKRVSAPGLQRS